jgi:hypothetical protein
MGRRQWATRRARDKIIVVEKERGQDIETGLAVAGNADVFMRTRPVVLLDHHVLLGLPPTPSLSLPLCVHFQTLF